MKMLMIFGATYGVQQDSVVKEHMGHSLVQLQHFFSNGYGVQVTLGNINSFFWLLLRDRLNTRNILKRKDMHLDDYNCVLCNLGCEETSFHLFFECPFSRDCCVTIPVDGKLNLTPLDMVLQARADFNNAIFREIAITACWVIWNTRNDVVFDNGQINIHLWKRQFKEEFGLVCTKAKAARQVKLSAWRDSYL